MRSWQASLILLVLGCGAPSSPTPSAATEVAQTPAPVVTEAPAPAVPAAQATRDLAVVAEGAVIAWPQEPAAAFTLVHLDLGSGVQALVAEDGKPLVAISADRFVVVPTDGTSPVRAYANERGLSSGCGVWRGVGVAGGAFLTCSGEGVLVARDIETLAVRWERTLPAPPRATYGAGDTFLVTTDASWVALDARSGATLWERSGVEGRGPQIVQGIVFDHDDARLVALDARTGQERFHVDAAGSHAEPIAGRGIALVPARSGTQIRDVRLVELDGSVRSVRLDAAVAEHARVLVDANALTTIVEVAPRRLEVRRYDLGAHTQARTARSETLDDTGRLDLQTLGRSVLLVNGLGARLLDAEQLTERWLGEDAGECTQLVAWRPTTSRAPVLACLVADELSLFVASPTPITRRRVTVSGTTRCAGHADRSTVHIEGRITETDDDGHYRVEVMADDDIDVFATALDTPMDTACSAERAEPVPPDARAMQLDVEMSWSSFDISGL